MSTRKLYRFHAQLSVTAYTAVWAESMEAARLQAEQRRVGVPELGDESTGWALGGDAARGPVAYEDDGPHAGEEDEPDPRVEQTMKRSGFALEGTGGNCTAYTRSLACGGELLVTAGTKAEGSWALAPRGFHEPVCAAVHCTEESDDDLVLFFPSLTAFLEAEA